jgi:hypothetical protein
MKNIIFKKYEKSRQDYGKMLDQIMSEWAWDSEDPMYETAFNYYRALKNDICPNRKEDVDIEEILTNELALNNINLSNLIITCLNNFPFKFRTYKIEWWKDDNCLGSESEYTDIYEDARLPYYYILHIDLFQSYKLLHKETGKLLNFTFHDLCPSDDNTILNGRHMHGDLSNYDFCSTLIDWSNDDIEGAAKVVANKNKEIFQNLILPTSTNVPYFYKPCANNIDFQFSHNIMNLVKKNYFGDLQLSIDNSKKSNISQNDIDKNVDHLPF